LLLINLSFDKDRHEELILLPVKLKLGRIELHMNVVACPPRFSKPA